jgi:hypothetical protein
VKHLLLLVLAPLAALALDTDGDSINDISDNCSLVANLDQRDTDNDGFGNICDPDFNQNGIVDPADFSLLKSRFGQMGFQDQDLNGNGIVDPVDFSLLKQRLGQPPGPGAVPGEVSLSWTPPTLNEDGSTLVDLAGYVIYYGNEEGNYPESVQLDDPTLETYIVGNLTEGDWFFVMTAINDEDIESAHSNWASKTL